MPSCSMAFIRAIGSGAPMRLCGQTIFVRCTMVGTPCSSKNEVSASPTPSSMMASSARKAGLARNACAATRTALSSAGV